MGKRCMKTHSLEIAKLKGVKGLQRIPLDEKPVVGIFGPNGVGKSTILHALAAAYNAPKNGVTHDFKSFFPRLAHDEWNGSHFKIEHTIKTSISEGQESTTYRKGTATTRWTPSCSKRPTREVCYVGLKSVVPALERHPSHNLSLTTETLDADPISATVLKAASGIMNIPYNCLAQIISTAHPSRKYLAVGREDFAAHLLTDVTLGAGEQRLIDLLFAVHRTKQFALILVDEFDLLLHGRALKNLLIHLTKHCKKENKQLIFTSHREEILKSDDLVSIFHLHQVASKHLYFPGADPDAIDRLTGTRHRKIEVFVEDKFAQTITNHVASDLGIGRHLSVVTFGDASNAFTVSAGLLLSGQTCAHSLFLIDGDVYRTEEAKQNVINSNCSGNDEKAKKARLKMKQIISDLVLPEGFSPEKYVHKLVTELDETSLSESQKELRQLAGEIIVPDNTHDYIKAVTEALGGDPAVQLNSIIQLASKHADWPVYVKPLHDWLAAKKTELKL